MHRLRRLVALLALSPVLACGGNECTEIDCDSVLEVDYGMVVVNEPYWLTIDPQGNKITVVCLADTPDAEPLPDWLACDAGGFTITGELADTTTTLNVAVVPLSTEEAVIPNALVPLMVDEIDEPNGPGCPPKCVTRRGVVN